MTEERKDNPAQWPEAWVMFDADLRSPVRLKIDGHVDRACFVFRTEEAGLAVTREVFGKHPDYPHRFYVRKLPREDVSDCLAEMWDRLNLQAFFDGETIWKIQDMH